MKRNEMNYYRQSRKDPSYTYRNAIYEYISEHPDLLYLADEWLREHDPDSEIFDWDGLKEILDGMDRIEILRLGCLSSDIDWRDDWLRFDGYGRLESLTDDLREYELMDVVGSDDFCEDVASGKIEIPEEMAAVVGIFTDKSRLAVSRNFAPRRKTAGKSVRKAPAAKKKASAPARKTVSKTKKPVRKASVARKGARR